MFLFLVMYPRCPQDVNSMWWYGGFDVVLCFFLGGNLTSKNGSQMNEELFLYIYVCYLTPVALDRSALFRPAHGTCAEKPSRFTPCG